MNLRTTPDALARFRDPKNVALFTKHRVLTEQEMTSRYRIILSNYCKVINIEALTMAEMVCREFVPSICKYTKFLADSIAVKSSVSAETALDCAYERETAAELSTITSRAFTMAQALERLVYEIRAERDVTRRAERVRDELCGKMSDIRALIDRAETITDRAYWPVPTYGELLYGVR